ncbi:hypothetical protein BT96DRAFT_542285 [Gymnopus androsaceus JB14]|uniref:Uncharacterized protein n=1 Tax=Gymnopus androsaceus JB14 TaxID=1447944 RepID=A0A6A4HX62_9AGAR|nr:hypothetical protein BT96DRAFT_542285 [Gymnopus androsaceus JB14]
MPDLKRRRKVEEVSTEEGVDIKRFKVEESSLLKSRKKTGTSKNFKKKSVSRTRISEKPYRKTSKLRERDTLREVTNVEMSFAVEPSPSRTARHLLDSPFSSDSIPSPEIPSSNEDSLQVVQISESTFTPQVSPALVHDDPPSPLSLHTPAARYSAEDVALDTDDLQSARSTDTTWPNHNPPRLISNRHSFQSVAQAVAFWNQPSNFPINPTTATATTTTTTTTSLLPRASPIRVSQWRPDSVWFSPPRSKPSSSPPLMSATSTSSTPSPPSPISRVAFTIHLDLSHPYFRQSLDFCQSRLRRCSKCST